MIEADPYRPLQLRVNPEPTIEEATSVSSDAVKEWLDSLTPADRIRGIEKLSQTVYESTADLLANPLLISEDRTAVNGLARSIDQRANWLSSDQINQAAA